MGTFIPRLYSMVNSTDIPQLQWGEHGLTIVVPSVEQLERIMPRYFKHANFTSFVRQLNLYGFHKVNSGNVLKTEGVVHEFYHPYFQRNRPELIEHVQRRVTKENGEVGQLKNELQGMRSRLTTLCTEVESLKDDNEKIKDSIMMVNDRFERLYKLLVVAFKGFPVENAMAIEGGAEGMPDLNSLTVPVESKKQDDETTKSVIDDSALFDNDEGLSLSDILEDV